MRPYMHGGEAISQSLSKKCVFIQSVMPSPEAKIGDLSLSVISVVVITELILYLSDSLNIFLFL